MSSEGIDKMHRNLAVWASLQPIYIEGSRVFEERYTQTKNLASQPSHDQKEGEACVYL